MIKILIINQPPFNRGDESAHKGLLRALLAHNGDLEIRVLSKMEWTESIRQYAIEDERVKYVFEPVDYLKLKGFCRRCMLYDVKRLMFLHPLFGMYKKHYAWADLVICAPGGICMGAFQDWNHLLMLHIAKMCHKPLVYYGRSFGPFPTKTKNNRRFKALSLEMLNYFCFLSIRDGKSEQLAKELGIPFVSTVDSAFLDSTIVEIPYEIKRAIGNTPYMVFVPNYLLWHYAFKDKTNHETIIQFYIKLMDVIWQNNPELNIVMLPQIFGRDNKYELSDVRMFRELADIKNDERIIITSDNYSSDIQQSIIRGAKYVIGARYHSIVFAINQGVPFVSLSYEHKMEGLLESLDRKEWCVDLLHTFDSSDNQLSTLNTINRLIPTLKKEDNTRELAKLKAKKCFDVFVEKLLD